MSIDPSDEHGYRPALDGIRPLRRWRCSVPPEYRWLRGGFLGVDVFFVLSGYLITGLLLAEHQRTGGFSLTGFWLRRAKRLLPALFFMIVAVALWLHFNAAPFELPLRRRDLLWTLFYGANWHFIASGQDYFAQFASASPLRHAWSLAVEEQFYLVWPLIVLVALAGGATGRWIGTICAAGIVARSLRWLFSTTLVIHRARTTELTRAFTSHSSARCSRYFCRAAGRGFRRAPCQLSWPPGRRSCWCQGLCSWATGALRITTACRLPSRSVPRRSYGQSRPPPVAGWHACWGCQQFDGLARSRYGLYLWHWPMILAIRPGSHSLAALPGSLRLSLTRLLSTFVVAAASWLVVEQPIRRGRVRFVGSPQRFAAAGAVTTALVATIVLWATAHEPTLDVALEIAGCPTSADEACLRRRGSEGRPVVALMGDSRARRLTLRFSSSPPSTIGHTCWPREMDAVFLTF